MKELEEKELKEIIASYGLGDLVFERFVQVGPDTAIYVFRDNNNLKYVLLVTDYLGEYGELKLPHEFSFDYYPDRVVKFNAKRGFSYIDDASKAATNYIDDKHLITQASTGDVCVLFSVDNVL